ncbi:MAG: SprT family zinc-dependent metalloprotease [bacterium]|nr:SprT family zinc-dependent metalloprotease [bacterium]
MRFEYKDKSYDIVVLKKRTTKNLYIKVKDDLKIYITCNTFTSDREIKRIVDNNRKSIERMLDRSIMLEEKKQDFYFLGKKYDIVYTNIDEVSLGENKIFLSKNIDLDKWLKKQALKIFSEHLENCYENFTRSIPHPSLRIRKMKTRWGVCNTKTYVITLNLELITKDINCLDYVIYHELSHLVEANHSKRFWAVVEENFKDYKKYRALTNDR